MGDFGWNPITHVNSRVSFSVNLTKLKLITTRSHNNVQNGPRMPCYKLSSRGPVFTHRTTQVQIELIDLANFSLIAIVLVINCNFE